MSKFWWVTPMLAFQVGDSITTALASPEMEANPVAAFTWMQFGFGGVIALKVLGLVLLYLGCKWVHSMSPDVKRLVVPFLNFGTACLTVTLCGVCVWNAHVVLSL